MPQFRVPHVDISDFSRWLFTRPPLHGFLTTSLVVLLNRDGLCSTVKRNGRALTKRELTRGGSEPSRERSRRVVDAVVSSNRICCRDDNQRGRVVVHV